MDIEQEWKSMCDDIAGILSDFKVKLNEHLKTSHNNDLKKVCLQCGGIGVMGDKNSNAECDSCHGTGKPIIKS